MADRAGTGNHRRPETPRDTQPRRPRRDTLTQTAAQRGIWFTRFTLAAGDILFGLDYVLGAPATSPTLQLLAAFAPMWAWGAALILAGSLIPVGLIVVAAPIGAFVWACWAAFNIITRLQGTATGSLWALFLVAAVLHGGMWVFLIIGRRSQRQDDTARPAQAAR